MNIEIEVKGDTPQFSSLGFSGFWKVTFSLSFFSCLSKLFGWAPRYIYVPEINLQQEKANVFVQLTKRNHHNDSDVMRAEISDWKGFYFLWVKVYHYRSLQLIILPKTSISLLNRLGVFHFFSKNWSETVHDHVKIWWWSVELSLSQ